MRRSWLSILALLLATASPGPGQETQRSVPDRPRASPPYTYRRADYAADLAAAKDPARRLEVLEKRWKAIRLAVAHAHVVSDGAFHSSMALWTSKFLITGDWTVRTDGDLTKAVREDRESTVLVRGDCLRQIGITGGALVHVLGDLGAEISVEGHCEVLIGGDVRKDGIIRGDGIVKIFVGGDVHGSIRNVASSTVWIAGNLGGEVATGTPSTDIHVMGDIVGGIAPAGDDAALLSVEARGHVPWRVLVKTSERAYTRFEGTIGSSDRPAGLYANRLATWVIHEQR
jgi:hypothetical protein